MCSRKLSEYLVLSQWTIVPDLFTAPWAKFQEECILHEVNLSKMEAEMKMV